MNSSRISIQDIEPVYSDIAEWKKTPRLEDLEVKDKQPVRRAKRAWVGICELYYLGSSTEKGFFILGLLSSALMGVVQPCTSIFFG